MACAWWLAARSLVRCRGVVQKLPPPRFLPSSRRRNQPQAPRGPVHCRVRTAVLLYCCCGLVGGWLVGGGCTGCWWVMGGWWLHYVGELFRAVGPTKTSHTNFNIKIPTVLTASSAWFSPLYRPALAYVGSTTSYYIIS